VIASADRLTPSGSVNQDWLESWHKDPEPDDRGKFVQFVWDHSETLLLGASDLIRVADRVAVPRELEIYANRGLSGIDGTVSTAVGIAQKGKSVTALIGDLTLLHDANGLNRSDLDQLNVRLVVGNDNGGHIFSRLEVSELLAAKSFERLFATPQQVDLQALAAAYGWQYFRCESLKDLESAWSQDGFVVIDYAL
jgi:2-succinyl-5-enolpyruvyl-6-hydroxy-3-cyclohexene-1-carboxylate synthase